MVIVQLIFCTTFGIKPKIHIASFLFSAADDSIFRYDQPEFLYRALLKSVTDKRIEKFESLIVHVWTPGKWKQFLYECLPEEYDRHLINKLFEFIETPCNVDINQGD